MKIQDLLNISLDEAGINLLVSLPEPPKSPLAKANAKELLESCKKFRQLWGELVIDEIKLPQVELKDMPEGMIVPTTDEEIWDSLFLTISCYFNFSFYRYMKLGKKQDLPSGLTYASLKQFIPDDPSKFNTKIYQIRMLSSSYFLCLNILYISPSLRNRVFPRGLSTLFEASYHDTVYDLYRSVNALPDSNKTPGQILFNTVLKYAKEVFAELPYDLQYRPGIFSQINTEELSLIASRDNKMIKRYSAKALEKIFEQQLALVMQSFGMYVVSTRLGVSTVDLLCISPFPEGQYTFLLEAKTTNKAYSLPRKDFRALKEYIDDVRHTLHTLPPLRFVLISAYKPSKTLDQKIRELQADTGMPVRFIGSQLITDLRENIIGLLPSDIFAEKVLSSPYILDNDFARELEKKHTAIQKAHSDFVETMFSAKGIIPNFRSHKAVED